MMRAALLFVTLWFVAPAYAQQGAGATAPAPTNDDCQMCHGEATATRADGSPVAVDAARFSGSVHGQLELRCVDCHVDLATAELPHPESLAPAQCSACHDTSAFQRSVHARASERGVAGAATCASCHGAHDILPSSDPASRTYHLNLSATCGECHGEQAGSRGIAGGDVASTFHDSIHGRALSRAGLLVAPSCATCHGAHEVLERSSPDSKVHRANVPQTCGSCHEGVEHVYMQSVHGAQFQKGNPQAPVCSDCHTAHRIQSASAGTFRLDVIGSACGECHKESLATYRDTFHGQVTELGFAETATCADCHTAHAQFPQSDPRSRVSPQNRLATCQQCHPGANANFAMYDPHANAHDHERGALLYYSARFMHLLFIGVFAFFGIHTTLWFTRSFQELRARQPVAHAADRHDTGAPSSEDGDRHE